MQLKQNLQVGLLYLCLFISLLSSCEEVPAESEIYQRSIQAWQQSRNENISDTSSWLSLAGLHWLEEGKNTFGADSNNAIQFPASAPAFAGSFNLKDSIVSIKVAEGVPVLHRGHPIDQMVLNDDMQEGTTYLQMGHLNFYIIRRPEGFAVRIRDSQNPELLAFKDIPNFPINANWQLEAKIEWYDKPRPIQIPTVLGSERTQYCPAKLIFTLEEETYELSPYNSYYGDPLWTIIFSDLTNGESTYGGGRFLDLPAPEAGTTTLTLDFNKAYNPPCAFSPYATCPLPPPENRLPIAIPAGEQMYGEMH